MEFHYSHWFLIHLNFVSFQFGLNWFLRSTHNKSRNAYPAFINCNTVFAVMLNSSSAVSVGQTESPLNTIECILL